MKCSMLSGTLANRNDFIGSPFVLQTVYTILRQTATQIPRKFVQNLLKKAEEFGGEELRARHGEMHGIEEVPFI